MARRFCTVKKARMVVTLVLGLAVVHMCPRVVDRFYTVELIGEPQFINFLLVLNFYCRDSCPCF